ncbi:hypothetical protein B296_00041025 [Ensete ventricosum]|uniref:Uncharacterized protein n=1 Tax=Ensete ventricosum TaxID=4639 RepID=A0A426XL94_ENSVE|nr:hypothetical protein B296_00041025 [Ensete ventricosum]
MKRNHRKDEENITNTFRYKHAEAESLRTKLAGWRLKSTFLLHACHLYPLAEALLLSSEREEEHQLLPSLQHGSPKWPFKIRRQKSRRKRDGSESGELWKEEEPSLVGHVSEKELVAVRRQHLMNSVSPRIRDGLTAAG